MTFGTTLFLWLFLLSSLGMVATLFFSPVWRLVRKIYTSFLIKKKAKEVLEQSSTSQKIVSHSSEVEKESPHSSPSPSHSPGKETLLGTKKSIGFGKKVPGEAVSLMRKGETLLARKDFDEAKKIFLKVLAWDEDNTSACLQLAYAYLQTGEHVKADAFYKKVVSKHTADAEVLTNYASCLFHLGKTEESLAMLRRAVELDEGNAERHSNLGQSLFCLKDFEGAYEAFLEANRLQPRNAEYLFFLADTLLALEKKSEAKEIFAKIVDLYPLNQEAKDELRRLTQEGV